ncbi:hypothetical protein [Sporosarcina sp. Te-1]|uniref:hypothetical protein n=1 Tax=Sporosarcina sp. Te-1 TaxID=2818390 RepID=UPI001A9E0D0B|nr:hypothetical protein [Sporosarcina sp. Te-1]QTD40247.1 hypothetical protein J3U78_15755 [Sporosarcina sp. Te-1]
MNKKGTTLTVSVFLNIILLITVFSMHSKLSNSKDLASIEIQFQLIELEKTIGEQMHSDWSNPEFVSKQLDKSLATMYRSLDLIKELSFNYNDEDSKYISSVLRKLESYKISENIESSENHSQDIDDYEALLAILRKEGFGAGITISVGNYDDFIKKMKGLNIELKNIWMKKIINVSKVEV